LILAILTDRIKNVPESLNIVFAPFAFAFIAYCFYWFLTYKAPVAIYTSIKNRTVFSDLRSIDWLGFAGALPGLFLFLGFFGVLFRFELLAVVMSFTLGFVIACVGWAIAPYLPEDLGRPILNTRPDLLWIGASSVAGVTATIMDVYVWMIGFFGIYAILLTLTLLSFIPVIVWVAFDRIKSIADVEEGIFRRRK
jgi:hypothetical protein